jgi:hypothetical protein
MNWRVGSTILALALACVSCKRTSETARNDTPQVVAGPEVTIVGCVKPTDTAVTGHSSDTNYMLTDAKQTGGPRESVGTSGSTSSAPITYRLDATDASMSPEVGHLVEIVAATPEPDPKAPKVKVQTIRMIAAACP